MPQLTDGQLESKIEDQIEQSQLIKTKKGVSLEWVLGGIVLTVLFMAGIITDLKTQQTKSTNEIEKIKEYKQEEKAQRDRIEVGVDNLRREVQKVREDVIEIKTRNSVNESNYKSF